MNPCKAVGAEKRRFPMLLLALLSLCVWMATGTALMAQLDDTCTVTMLNRTVQVNANGTFSIPNVPVDAGLFRVRATCVRNGVTIVGQSAYVELVPNGSTPIPPIQLGFSDPVPVSIKILSSKTSFKTKGETTLLLAIATMPDGSMKDLSHLSDGTTWSSSNPRIATVDTNGTVTALARGQAIVQARNEGVIATTVINVLIPNDADGDGIPDEYEIAHGMNPNDPSDAAKDFDADGLTNLQEYNLGTNPRLADTDGDGIPDGQEVALSTNPLKADTDGDGLNDGDELKRGLNPLLADSDGDGIPDGLELQLGLNPLVADATTSVQGRVVDATNGAPVSGASIVLFNVLTTTTDGTGFFSVRRVPAGIGNIIAGAQIIRASQVFDGESPAVSPVINGLTDVGTIQVKLNSGNVIGVVTDPFSHPVAGAQVTVTSSNSVRVVNADNLGRYRVGNMTAGPLLVTVRDFKTGLRGYNTGTLGLNQSVSINVALGPYGSVVGSIYDQDGTTPVGSGVLVAMSGSSSQNASTDVLGRYRFEFVPLGNFTEDCSDGAGNHGRTAGNISASAQVFVADISYLGAGRITGVIRDGALNPVSNATVNFSSSSVFGGSGVTTSDAFGRYTFSNVFVGPYNLSAQAPVARLGGVASGLLEQEGQTVTNDIVLTSSGTITGTVFRADGTTPVTNVTVNLSLGLRATTDSLGQYSFTFVPLGSYSIDVTDPATGDRGRAGTSIVSQDQIRTVNINLNGLGSVAVTVVDGGNVPVTGAQVSLTSQTQFGGTQTGISQLGGAVNFPSVLAGSFSVSAYDPSTGLSGSTNGGVAAGGGTGVTVRLQPAGSVLGTLFAAGGVTPIPNYTVYVSGPVYRQKSTGNDGTFRFDILPTGTYSLRAVDSFGNLRASVNGVVVSSHGQLVTQNLVLVGIGTVAGIVRSPESNGVPNLSVVLASQNATFGGTFYARTDINGGYSIGDVPVGAFSVSASGQVAQTNYFGSTNGLVQVNGEVVTANIQLQANLIPLNPGGGSGSPSYTLFDANNFAYNIRGDGTIQDGTENVFLGDSLLNHGAGILDLVVGGNTNRFLGQGFASSLQGGRELSIFQPGVGGLDVTRRIFVPTNGYFARYLEVVSNPSANPITFQLRLNSNLRFISRVINRNTINFEPRIISTSSGDTTLEGPTSLTPDRWVVLDDDTDSDPFIVGNNIPAVADVFDGTNGVIGAGLASYAINFSNLYGKVVQVWTNITVQPGSNVAIMHFVSEQTTRAAALASAQRLVQLPPETLIGMSAADRAAVRNFLVPSNGVSTITPLPELTGSINGRVLAGNGTNTIGNAPVTFQSTNILFGRTFSTTANAGGLFQFDGFLNNSGSSMPIPVDGFRLLAVNPLTGLESPNTAGSFAVGTNVTTRNVIFPDNGVLVGTVRRHNGVVVSGGLVTVSGTPLLNDLSLGIAVDGTFGVAGLPSDTYTLVATVPTAQGSSLSGSTSAPILGAQTTTADITIQPTGTLVGTVRRQNNSVVVALQVQLRGSNGLTRATTTDTGGRFTFVDVPTGAVTLEAFESFSNTAARNQATVFTDLTTTNNLTLSSGGTVVGVVTKAGVSVVGAQVSLTSSNGVVNTTTGADGSYRFDLVPLGNVTVVAVDSVSTFRGRNSGNLAVSGQTLTLNVGVVASGMISGTVYRPNGATPVAGATVSLSPLALSTTTDGSGHYSFDFIPLNTYTVSATEPVKGESGSISAQVASNLQNVTADVVLRPRISIDDVSVTEGNVGTTNAVFSVKLSSASVLTVAVNYFTANSSAAAGSDYQSKSGSLIFSPGVTNLPLSIVVNGDTTTEPDEDFMVVLSAPSNATLSKSQGTGIIFNDDGFPGKIDHFDWAPIASPQFVLTPFAVTITAKDFFGTTVSNFSGPVTLAGLNGGGASTNTVLGDEAAAFSGTGDYTLGYAITPTTNMVVTHVRHYSGTKVSIWDNTGTLVVAQAVSGLAGTWSETALPSSVTLLAGTTYRVAFYTAGGTYYYRNNRPATFPTGTIANGYYFATGDGFPATFSAGGSTAWMVDLRYTVGADLSVAVLPTASGTFSNGVWSGDLTVQASATNFVLRALDNDGHIGNANGIAVLYQNDIGVLISDSPEPVGSGALLTYVTSVTNSGPVNATNVVVTNFLPASVSIVSAAASQGTVATNGRTITGTLGVLPPNVIATLTVTVTPTAAGLITNIAGVTRSGVDPYPNNNTAVAVTTVLLPTLSVTDTNVTEGNVGTQNAVFSVNLSYPSSQTVQVNFASSNGTAIAGLDYVSTNGTLTFTPGQTNKTITVRIISDTTFEPNESFFVNLSAAVNATISDGQGTGTIVNDDGLSGFVDHFEWTTIPSPQYANVAFPVTVAAKDAFGSTVSNFSGTVALSAVVGGGLASNNILSNMVGSFSGSGTFTLGYSFTPNTNITVTHVRHYSGSKVSIWTDTGVLLRSQNVVSTPGTWLETALATPITLTNGIRYRIAAYTGGGSYYYRFDGSSTFANGTIDQSYQTSGDNFPGSSDGVRWWLVDLRYTTGSEAPLGISLATSGSFSNGVWSGDLTTLSSGSNAVLRANDGDGHSGGSEPFLILYRDDISLTVLDAPDPVAVGGSLSYILNVSNTGPSVATSVVVTNFLPANVSLQGTTVPSDPPGITVNSVGRTVTFGIPTVPAGTNIALGISVSTLTSGLLTNIAGVTRAEADANLSNNLVSTVTTVLLPTLSITGTNVTEGNVGTRDAIFNVALSFPSSQTITVGFGTSNGTAAAGLDYFQTNGVLTFTPGQTNRTITVRVIGDIAVELNENYFVTLSNAVNASIASAQASGLIINDDGALGFVDHFDWAPIPNQQFVGVPFPVTVTAKDIVGDTVTGFTGPVTLTGSTGGTAVTNKILGDLVNSSSSSGTYTLGYSFTPSTNISVTHVRSYWGTKVSVWTDAGSLVFSQPVSSVNGTWVETLLPSPVTLLAGVRYRVGAYTGGGSFYYRSDGITNFPNGSIDQGYEVSGDAFPANSDGQRWWFVDLKYTVDSSVSAPITPTVSGTFSNGVWMGNVTVQTLSSNLTLRANDGDGHGGAANPFAVLVQNDIAVTATASLEPADVRSNLTYVVIVTNSGPLSASGVVISNTLPGGVNLISLTSSTGTITTNGGLVTCNVGTMASGQAETLTIVVKPVVDGVFITNLTTVGRSDADGFAGNNSFALVSRVRSFLGGVGGGNIAILTAEGSAAWNTDVRNKILATGLFTGVDVISVSSFGSTPTLAQLQQYSAVLTFSDGSYGDPTGLGNALADYSDAGGGVVVGTFAFGSGIAIGGRLQTGGYLPLTIASQTSGTATLVKDDASHPILEGVNNFNGGSSSYRNTSSLTSGSTLVAHWSSGQPLIAVKQLTTGRVVGMNFFPPSSDVRSDFWVASTDGARLMANSLAFAAGGVGIVPDDIAVSVTDSPDPVALGGTVTYTVTVTNSGPSAAAGVTVTNFIPATANLISFSASQGNATNIGNQVRGDLGTIPGGSNATLTVQVAALSTGVMTNVAAIGRAEPDGYLKNNQASTVSTVVMPSIYISDTSVNEGDSGTTNAIFTVSLSLPSPSTVSVAYNTGNSSATPEVDYLSTNGVIVFAPGETNKTVAVSVVGDTTYEANEQFVVFLFSSTNATISDSIGTGTIVNDDPLPLLNISGGSVVEGNSGTNTITFNVTLSAPSGLSATVNYSTADDTAQSGSDYLAKSGSLTLLAGQTNASFTVTVLGDVSIELDETFFVNIFSPGNASINVSQAVGTILNDDGFAGQIDHFDWSLIPSPQIVGQSFPVSITAKDAGGLTLSSFTGPINLSSVAGGGLITNTILSNVPPTSSSSGTYTMGFTFTPNTNITVTHVRHIFGTKVSIWTDAGVLVASQPVISTPGVWAETALPVPVQLTAGVRYRVGAYSAGGTYYYLSSPPATFTSGVLHEGVYSSGDTFPTSLVGSGTAYMADIRYTIGSQMLVPFTPTVTGGFTNGVWAGDITVQAPATNLVLRASDAEGHSGSANSIDVALLNDLSIAMSALPDPADVRSNITYTITVSNSGPATATGVMVSNPLPAELYFVSAVSTDGTCVNNGGIVTCNIGSLLGGQAATITLVTQPNNDGTITNTATVSRAESESFLTNNSASVATRVLVPGSFQITALLATGASAIEANFYTGDDRGGLVVSASQAFLTGDNSTARFSASDLTGGAALGRLFDAMVGDLQSQKIYTLANGPIAIGSSGGTVTTLVEIDGITGLLSGNVITLSAPITVTSSGNVGIFSGYGMVAIHNGTRVYRIDLPSGIVTDLGAMTVPSHQGTESWAYWGVAENVSGVVSLVYGRNSSTISRSRVPDGLTTTVATFSGSGLSDLASFNVSVPRNRWYYHYEGSGLFRSGDETLGYADAIFSVVGAGISNDLVLAMSANTNAVGVGGNITYTLTVTNTGPDTATGVAINNPLPLGASLIGSSTTAGTVANSNGMIVCSIGNLPVGSDVVVTLTLSPSYSGQMTNVATVIRGEPDGYLRNNQAAVATTVFPPTMNMSDAFVAEGNTGTNTMNFLVTLSAPSTQIISVTYESYDDTAVDGEDYLGVFGALIFNPGETNKFISIPILGDTLNEMDETFYLDLYNPTNVNLATFEQIGTIVNDDAVPDMTIADVEMEEGNKGLKLFNFEVTLSAPSGQTITVDYNTSDGAATNGVDYYGASGHLVFLPGVTNMTIPVAVIGNVKVEDYKYFFIDLYNTVNATNSINYAVGYIWNDDGFDGQIDHFTWAPINSPQVTSNAFVVEVTAKDFANNTLTNYSGPLNFTGSLGGGIIDTNMLGNVDWSSGSSAYYTFGYSFTPATNLLVTHVRSYFGVKVSIWTDTGTLVASQNVTGTPASWSETPLSTPVTLLAGTKYRIGCFTGAALAAAALAPGGISGGDFYWRNDGPTNFGFGVIDQGYEAFGDNFPNSTDSLQWVLVDLKFTVDARVTVPLDVQSGSFSNGIWTGLIAVNGVATNLVLVADDGDGHEGSSSSFDVLTAPVVPAVVSGLMMDALAPGVLKLQVTGGASGNCVIETSEDMIHWTPMCTNNLAAGEFIVVDPNANSLNHCFYRVRTVK